MECVNKKTLDILVIPNWCQGNQRLFILVKQTWSHVPFYEFISIINFWHYKFLDKMWANFSWIIFLQTYVIPNYKSSIWNCWNSLTKTNLMILRLGSMFSKTWWMWLNLKWIWWKSWNTNLMMILNKKKFMIYMINRGWDVIIHTKFNFEYIHSKWNIWW